MKLILAALAASTLLGGCIVASAAGAVVGATGAVVGGTVDLVTTSKAEQNAKDVKTLRKENEALKRERDGDDR